MLDIECVIVVRGTLCMYREWRVRCTQPKCTSKGAVSFRHNGVGDETLARYHLQQSGWRIGCMEIKCPACRGIDLVSS